ncbi:MAG: TonB family protein [Pyrinomonadaceae bacterium]
MRYCPVCQTRYDEEIVRFCTKDGAPLVEENPSFTAMPSESLIEPEDDGEETVIRRNSPAPDLPRASSERIVIPTNEIKTEPVRAKTQTAYQPPKKPNTTVTVLLTILGTFVVLGALGGIWYLLRGNNSNDANANKTNANFNIASNVANFNANFNAANSLSNFNANANFNANFNANANLKTPTPTRTPTPTPTPTPVNSNANANQNPNLNLGNTNIMSRPTATPSASPTPRISPTPTAAPPQNVNVGVMNSRAVSLTTPAYPQSARQANASGQVTVQITVDEQGNVTSAKAISGHPLLRSAAEAAARQSRFNPVKIGDRPVSATGLLVYNFINQ